MLQVGEGGYFKWHEPKLGLSENVVIKELLNDIDKLFEEKNQRGNDVNQIFKVKKIHLEDRWLCGPLWGRWLCGPLRGR